MTNKNYQLKTVIIDDEPDAVEILQDLILENCPELEIVGVGHSVREGKELLAELQPDVVFLDIQMPGGTGFDLLRQTEQLAFKTVFVSAHENYAIEAIKFHAMAYLLKPVAIDELKEAVQMVKDEILGQIKADYEALLHNLGGASDKRIAIPTGKGHRYFETREIIRVEAAKNYSNVYTTEDSKPILVSKNLKQFELLLAKYGFLRIHHAHLINPYHIREYARQDGGSVVLTDGENIYVGNSYRTIVVDYLSGTSDRL